MMTKGIAQDIIEDRAATNSRFGMMLRCFQEENRWHYLLSFSLNTKNIKKPKAKAWFCGGMYWIKPIAKWVMTAWKNILICLFVNNRGFMGFMFHEFLPSATFEDLLSNSKLCTLAGPVMKIHCWMIRGPFCLAGCCLKHVRINPSNWLNKKGMMQDIRAFWWLLIKLIFYVHSTVQRNI